MSTFARALVMLGCVLVASCSASTNTAIKNYAQSVEQQSGTSAVLLNRCRVGSQDMAACDALNQSILVLGQSAHLLSAP